MYMINLLMYNIHNPTTGYTVLIGSGFLPSRHTTLNPPKTALQGLVWL